MTNELTTQENQELEQCEAVIEQGLKTFVDVGNALLEIRDKRLYRAEYGTWEEYCQERWDFTIERARLLMRGAEVVKNISETPTNVGVLPQNEAQARPLARLEPEQQREAWQQVIEETPKGKITGAKVQEVVDRIQGNTLPKPIDKPQDKPHVTHNSGNNEWYTPPEYIEAARRVMGTIDLDPASSDKANETVQAGTYYTAETNGLAQEWIGGVWINPPYSSDLIGQFCEKLIGHVQAGDVREACVLVNNATETGWFQTLLQEAACICLLKGRVKFIDAEGNPSGAPLQGQIVLYIGPHDTQFAAEFAQFGAIFHAW